MGIDAWRTDGGETGCIDIMESDELKPSAMATTWTVMRDCGQRAMDIPFE